MILLGCGRGTDLLALIEHRETVETQDRLRRSKRRRRYVQSKKTELGRKRWLRTHCRDCGLPFLRPLHGGSALCGFCVEEYELGHRP